MSDLNVCRQCGGLQSNGCTHIGHSPTKCDEPAMPGDKVTPMPGGGAYRETTGGLTKREYAAIHLRVPDSGDEVIDAMIRKARIDHFAGLAMQGLLANPDSASSISAVINSAISSAGVLIAAREKQP